jgi:hypothetical protein
MDPAILITTAVMRTQKEIRTSGKGLHGTEKGTSFRLDQRFMNESNLLLEARSFLMIFRHSPKGLDH